MKSIVRLVGIAAIIAVIGFAVAACGDSGGDGDDDNTDGNNPGGGGNVDIYISGSYWDWDNYDSLCYWKNGVRTDLSLPAGARGFDDLTGIAVSGSSVYVAGNYFVGNDNDWNSTPCYWKDGVRTDLPVPAGAEGDAYGIAVSGNSVYVAGGYSGNNGGVACYWKDGIRTDLPVPAGTEGDVSVGIAVSGNSVYVVGGYSVGSFFDFDGNIDGNFVITPCYWKDGVRTDLPIPAGTSVGDMVFDIAVSENSVYVSGYYYDNNDNSVACYWKDGVRTNLSVPARTESGATGIAVVAR